LEALAWRLCDIRMHNMAKIFWKPQLKLLLFVKTPLLDRCMRDWRVCQAVSASTQARSILLVVRKFRDVFHSLSVSKRRHSKHPICPHVNVHVVLARLDESAG